MRPILLACLLILLTSCRGAVIHILPTATPSSAAPTVASNPPAFPSASPTVAPLSPSARTVPATPPRPPAAYGSLYNQLKNVLDAADSKLTTDLKGRTYPVVFGAELIVADSNRGTDLLLPEALSATQLYLDRLQAIGIRGVKVSLQYPLFTPSFPNFSRYLDFYRQVADMVRARRMVLTIQASIIFAGTGFTTLPINYNGLALDKYKAEDKQMVQTIISTLHPDYVVVVAEPDTAATLTGIKELNDPVQSAEFVKFILQGLDRASTKVAAGTGTWSPLAFAERYARDTSLDCIVLHMYPVSRQTLTNAYEMAALAKRNGKCVLINESWLYKTIDPRGGNHVAASEAVFKLDAYSFWQPLDEEFLGMMVKLSDLLQADFFSPFWSNFLFGYVDYSPQLDQQSYAQVRQQANQAAFRNLQFGQLSETGAYYKQLISEHK